MLFSAALKTDSSNSAGILARDLPKGATPGCGWNNESFWLGKAVIFVSCMPVPLFSQNGSVESQLDSRSFSAHCMVRLNRADCNFCANSPSGAACAKTALRAFRIGPSTLIGYSAVFSLTQAAYMSTADAKRWARVSSVTLPFIVGAEENAARHRRTCMRKTIFSAVKSLVAE